MKTKIIATTFNGEKIEPVIEWFVEMEKNRNLDEKLFNKLKNRLGMGNIDFNIVSKDLENLKNRSIVIDEESFITNILAPLIFIPSITFERIYSEFSPIPPVKTTASIFSSIAV